MEYSGTNKVISQTFYDTEGNITATADGYARIESQYNSSDKVMATLYYDAAGNLMLTPGKEYAYVRTISAADKQILGETGAILPDDEEETDGTVFLTLENTTSDAMMVNVVGINRHEAVARFLLPTDGDSTLILPPGTTELPFIKVFPSPEVEYRAFPVSDGIDYSLLQRLLSERQVR